MDKSDEDGTWMVSRHDTRLTNFLCLFLFSLGRTRSLSSAAFGRFGQEQRSGQAGKGWTMHRMLICDRHVRPRILIFCIRFCIFLSCIVLLVWGTHHPAKGVQDNLLLYGGAHAFHPSQSVSQCWIITALSKGIL